MVEHTAVVYNKKVHIHHIPIKPTLSTSTYQLNNTLGAHHTTSTSNMHLRTIDYALIAADTEEVTHLQRTSLPTARSHRFNTARHTRQEILTTVPEPASFTHKSPPWTAYGYVLWQPLISRSQKIDSHTIRIPSFLYEDLMCCNAAWLSTNTVPPALVEGMVEAWQSTRRGREATHLLDGEKKWFIRLDQMAPKDSPYGGKAPSTSMADVLTKLCSSMRARDCLLDEQKTADAEGREVQLDLVLNPWDEDMDIATEFRVFVPPPAARGAPSTLHSLCVAAVSQYKWHAPFASPFGFDAEHTAELVCAGAEALLNEIRSFLRDETSPKIQELLVEYGFVFDVSLRRGGEVVLVEVNPFGAMSICGACLFQWVRDGRVVYGFEGEVVVKVAV
jgi:hypothetical protein